mmetsp:Transcript_17474/g.19741  ORF Transcript_17474/g.19741 Transcript_17474/m.19741 type:complete len:419 (-) Transcript_17474:1499-2755(-)|eukprot:CAMPEP_0114990222 /NCGR_PEP_ID=MMETSP0216-20121206/10667_1 /TAXON_ID=223996 /ORGANISM="Protocruzia adherens, Strain Boccale" /LENGTH=418 /DNA_ID=CAMNT_0002353355 /DNA_START=444 /DNA_END=1700 /DNA_ORIENTATION=-
MAEEAELPDYDSGDEQEEGKGYAGGVKKGHYAGIHSSSFKDFLLKAEILKSITDCGFEHPSEVQQECIPQSILGGDVLCQAKSGMGKTAVFVLSVLHRIDESVTDAVQAIVLGHARELAYQINSEFKRFSKYMPNIRTEVIYGGEPIEKQKARLKNPPQIIVGTPGRVLHLCRTNVLKLDKLKFFILDECDKLLEQLDMRGDVQSIFKMTPHDKQVMMFSATLSKNVRPVCKKFMRNQLEIFIDDESKLTLHGLQQYYVKLEERDKNKKLIDLLDALLFNQVVIFVCNIDRATQLNNLLSECNFPTICIHSRLDQETRIKRFQQFKKFEKRLMVATDIFGRGIDIEKVNIVINYDMPDSSDSYLHRVGRAGRFGTKGLGISFVTEKEEDNKVLADIQSRFEVNISELPEQIDVNSYMQ